MLADTACLCKILELCHHDRILCSHAIPQRHFQSLYFAQNKPTQTAIGIHDTSPRVSNLTLGYSNIHLSTMYHRWKRLQERSVQVKRPRLPLYFTIYRQRWIDPRPQTSDSLKGQQQQTGNTRLLEVLN